MKRLLLTTFSLLFTFTVLSCSDNSTGSDPESEEITGVLEVTTNTSGSDLDSDGYILTVDGSDQSIDINETVAVEELEEGSYEAELSNIANNCSSSAENPRNFDITAEETTSMTFEVNCESSEDGASGSSNEIVFQSDRDGDDEIFIMNVDGANQQKLTDNSHMDRHPVISNDGTQIAFVSYRNEAVNIYIMNIDGSDVKQVTESYDMPFSPHLSWSADDSQIAFHDKRSGNGEVNEDEAFYNEIYTIDTDGSNLTRLTENDTFDGSPSWSPEGDQIVFNSSRDGGVNADQEIYTMNVSDLDPQRLTDDEYSNSEPRWSPDGSKIVFQTDRDANDDGTGNYNVYVLSTDDSGVQQLTDYTGTDNDPAWSPDGTEIIFTTNRDLNREIYKVNADGTGTPTNLSDNSESDEAPFWNPAE